MTEIYQNVRDEVKTTARFAWQIALAQETPVVAANFLNNVTNYFKHSYTDEEIEFLQFYFKMQMEMMKE